jgi:hypothetical protein
MESLPWLFPWFLWRLPNKKILDVPLLLAKHNTFVGDIGEFKSTCNLGKPSRTRSIDWIPGSLMQQFCKVSRVNHKILEFAKVVPGVSEWLVILVNEWRWITYQHPGFQVLQHSSFITCYNPRTSDLTDCQDLLRSVATIFVGGFIRD